MFLPLLVVISAQIICAQFSIHFESKFDIAVRGLCFRYLFIYDASHATPPPICWFLEV